MEGNRKPCMKGLSWAGKRYFRPLMTAVLTVTMVIGNMAASLNTAMAGQAIAKEEFRIHAEAIRAAAEKALKEGEPLTEPLTIGGKDKSLVKDYGKLLEANGTLYELDLFKDTETVKDVDGISLRVFMRLEEDDDPKSYALTGEEKLIFLYVNGSDETISARLNIDGYVSGFSTVRPYDAAFGNKEAEEAQSPGGTSGTEEETTQTEETQGTPGGSGSGSGAGSGGSGSGNAGGAEAEEPVSDPDKSEADVTENADPAKGETAGTEGEKQEETEERTEGEETKAEETQQNPDEQEGEAETEEQASEEDQTKKDDPTETREEAKNEENEGSGKTEAPSDDKKEDTGNQAEAGTEDKDSSEKDNSGKDGSQDNKDQKADAADSSGNAGNAGDSGQADTGHESSGKDSGDTAKDSAQDDGKDSGKDSSVKDDSSDSKDSGAEKADDSKDSSAKDTGDSKDSGAKDTGDSKDSSAKDDSSKDSGDSKDSGSKDTGSEAKDSPDSKDAGEGKEQAQAIGISLHEITRVAKGQASDSDADDENADSDYEEGGDPFDAEDAAKLAQEEQEKSFNRRGALSGKIYNLVSLEDSLTARAFQTSLSKMGMDAGELAEGSHILTYNVNPVGSAVLVRIPELVRDEAEVTFGVIPQVGYHIKDVTVNGESLEETGAESMASSSDAVKKALASSSDARKGNEEFLEEDARFYTIPSVLEDQEVEIWLSEEVDGSHPEFREAKTVNGVTVTVSAEEGILPEGTYLSVEEVTEQVESALTEKLIEEGGMAAPSVLAYDINLMLDGKKLSNDYWKDDHVVVNFSGAKIEQLTKDANTVKIMTLETPTLEVEAALGDKEEMPMLEDLKAEDIGWKEDEVKTVDVSGDDGVEELEYEAEHFTVTAVALASEDVIELKPGDTVRVKVGETITVRYPGGSNWMCAGFNPDGGSITQPGSATISANGDVVTIRGETDGPAYLFCQSQDQWVIWDLQIGNGAGGEPTYFYILKPGYKMEDVVGDTENYPSRWYFAGIGSVKDPNEGFAEGNVSAPVHGETVTFKCAGGDGHDCNKKDQYLTYDVYPKIKFGDEYYTYSAEPNAGGNTYSVIWDNMPWSNGANVNLNPDGETDNHFIVKSTSEKTCLHVNGIAVLSNHITVVFKVKDPITGEFRILDRYTQVLSTGDNAKRPEYYDDQFLETITDGTDTYYFEDQWYKEEGFTNAYSGEFNEATLRGLAVDGVVTFYGRYLQQVPAPKHELKVHKTLSSLDETTEPYISKVQEVQFKLVTIDEFENDTEAQYYNPDRKGDISFRLAPGKYRLYETKSAEGYQCLTEDQFIEFEIDAEDNVTSIKINESDHWNLVNGAEPINSILNIINDPLQQPGVLLPETGGPGIGLIKEFGWMLLILAMMMAGAEVRYYGDRRRKQRAEI